MGRLILSVALIAARLALPAHASVCAPCHEGIAKTYSRTGMGRSWLPIGEAPHVEDFTRSNRLVHQASRRYYDIKQDEGRFILRRQQVDEDGRPENVVEKQLDFVLGSGNHARSYVHRTPLGKLLAMPVSWYAERGGYWEMAPGYERPDHVDFRREIGAECLFCHAAYPDALGSVKAIDCERCHGSGVEHVKAAQEGEARAKLRSTIVNPSRLSRDRQLEVCYQCHLQTTSGALPHSIRFSERAVFSYQPGEPLGDYIVHFDHAPGSGRDNKFEVVGAAYRLRQSACFQKSALTCTTCHNPHATPEPEKAEKQYGAVCISCHDVQLAKLRAKNQHAPATDCVGCHMQRRRPEDAVHTTLTDHKIQRRPMVIEEEQTRPPYKGEVVLYYPERLSPGPDRDVLLGLAQVEDAANDRKGIELLKQALTRPSRLHVPGGLGLAAAYFRTGNSNAALAIEERLAAQHPTDARILRSWGTMLLQANQAGPAIKPLERARDVNPADAATLHQLGEAYRKTGRMADAIAVLEQCTQVDPDEPECFMSLGASEYAAGNRAAATSALQRAILLAPELAAAHNSLATVLLDQNPKEAMRHFRQATELDPSFREAYVGYGSALVSINDLAGARRAWEQALKLGFRDALLHVNLGTLYARSGDMAGALKMYRDALAINPRMGEARLNLGITLAKLGRPGEAAKELQQAAQSGNPAVLKAAEDALSALSK